MDGLIETNFKETSTSAITRNFPVVYNKTPFPVLGKVVIANGHDHSSVNIDLLSNTQFSLLRGWYGGEGAFSDTMYAPIYFRGY